MNEENSMSLQYAIQLCRSIGECEIGTIRKQAISRIIDELLQNSSKIITNIDNKGKKW